MRYYILLLLSLIPSFFLSSHASAAPKVVATIQPLHALAAGVMGEIATPTLLIKGGHSPHNYSLRPSEAKALADANLIIWIGPELESFLVKPLANLAYGTRQLALLQQPELTRLPQRAGGTWNVNDHHADETEHEREKSKDLAGSYNPHLWLDPQNAIHIIRLLADVLTELDPTNSTAYHNNALILQKRLQELDQELDQSLSSINDLPYLVFHDAYPYFEQRYNLNPLGAISVSPERRTGAKRIAEIREKIKTSEARCVFAEPQFKPQLIETLISGTSAKSGILDPLGADLTAGPESYFTLLRQMANSLQQCLREKP